MSIVICLDMDGTVVTHRYPSMGEPVPGAIPWIRRWIEAGAKIVLFTMRDKKELDDAVQFFKANNLPLHGINRNPDQDWTDSPKAYGQIYVDDAAFGCPLADDPAPIHARKYVDWNVVGPGVLKRIVEDQRVA